MGKSKMIVPAARGEQSGREFYVGTLPLRDLKVIGAARSAGRVVKTEQTLALRAEPGANAVVSFLPVVNTVVVYVDGPVQFDPMEGSPLYQQVGRVSFDPSLATWGDANGMARDWQTRRQSPRDSVAVLIIPNADSKAIRKALAELEEHESCAQPPISRTQDRRLRAARLAEHIVTEVPYFAGLTETEKTTISNRSTKLFTLSAIRNASQSLFIGIETRSEHERLALAVSFWTEVGKSLTEWKLAADRRVSPAELRREYIDVHGLALAAIARAGNQLLRERPGQWKRTLKSLSSMDWRRSSAQLWEGRAMNAGRLSKHSVNVTLTANVLKRHFGLALSEDEERVEQEFSEAQRSRAR